MSEQVEVFKNVNNVSPSALDVGFDINLLTTTSTQRAVIKDVVANGFAHTGVTLDLDGFPVAQGQALAIGGNLIMGPSSTLKLVVTTPTPENNGFTGLLFTEGSTGLQLIKGDATHYDLTTFPPPSITPTKIHANNIQANDATAAKVDGKLYFYRAYSSNVYRYDETGAGGIYAGMPHDAQGMTNDGTYLYITGSTGGVTNKIYRTTLDGHTAWTTLTTTSNYYCKQGNQGSYFLHHEGKLYSKREGGTTTLYVIDVGTLGVSSTSDAAFSVGSYSDGACIVTTEGGTSYIVEQGTNNWMYYNISTNTPYSIAGQGSGASTEYGEGGAEVVPGIAVIFGEESDDVTVIDLNPLDSGGSPLRTHSDGSHGYTTDYAYGNRTSFAGFMDVGLVDYAYNVYVSGILIED